MKKIEKDWDHNLTYKIDMESQILALFDTSPLTQFSKFNNYLWVCWFLCKNLPNFVPPTWKLHNPYCHNQHFLIFAKYLSPGDKKPNTNCQISLFWLISYNLTEDTSFLFFEPFKKKAINLPFEVDLQDRQWYEYLANCSTFAWILEATRVKWL